MNKYQSLRANGKLHGTIKRATALAATRLQNKATDPLIVARAERPHKATQLRLTKSEALVPTRQQAVQLLKQVAVAIAAAEGRCSERCLSVNQVIEIAATPGQRVNGGTITSGSYKYRWTTTAAWSSVLPNGDVAVRVDRTSTVTQPSGREVAAPIGHWRRITADPAVLLGGGIVAIRKGKHWECLDRNAKRVGVAVRINNAEVAARFGRYEHGATVAECNDEISRKVAIIAEDKATKAESERRERAAKILCKIGCKTDIRASMAQAAGACSAGIAAFAARIGKTASDTVTLTELAAIEPVWAVRIARTLVRG